MDEKNNEIFVGDPGDRRVLVYKRDADGDAKPLRTIQGAKTKLLQIVGIAVDPVRDLLVVSTYSRLPGGVTGLLIFKRTDNGDVAPQRVIAGPKTGITRLRQIGLDPGDRPDLRRRRSTTSTCRPTTSTSRAQGSPADVELPSPWNTGSEGFIGVWNDEGDDGDVPPHSIIKGRSTGIVHPAGVTFNAKDGEVIAPDAVWNGLFTFLKPELFKMPAAAGRDDSTPPRHPRPPDDADVRPGDVHRRRAAGHGQHHLALRAQGVRRRSAEADSVGPRRLPAGRGQRRPDRCSDYVAQDARA